MKNNNDISSHQSILKSTGVFGFVQIFKIIVNVIGSKCIAIFLGPIGIGTLGLLNSTLAIITSLTCFGFNTISVREISVSRLENCSKKLSESLYLMHRWAIIIGLLGGIVSIVFSKVLSRLTFGTDVYYFWFVLFAVNFMLNSITASKVAILQSFRKMKSIAFSTVLSSVVITFCSIPLYYFFKFNGILWVTIVSSVVNLIIQYYFTRTIKIENLNYTFSEIIAKGKPIVKLGFLLSINLIFGYLCTYLIKMYLNYNGTSTAILGYYEVSIVLLTSYVGLIFNAMGTDFYPKLTSIHNDKKEIDVLVNNQIEIGLLIATPLLLLFYVVAPYIVIWFYSQEFLPVLDILKAGILAVMVKVVIWPLAFIILAKGENKLYFRQEILGDFLNITSTILFYSYFGLVGIGIATVLNYSIYGVVVYFILNKKFQFQIRKATLLLIIVSLSLGVATSLILFYLDYKNAFPFLALFFIISSVFSCIEMNKRIDFREIINKFKNR